MSYIRVLTMVAVSTAIMFGLMYLNVFSFDHVFFSETRLFMALIMGSVMAVVMLTFMLNMYTNMAANLAIYAGAAILFAGSLYLVRSQETVGDVAWMKVMIPRTPSSRWSVVVQSPPSASIRVTKEPRNGT